MDRHIALEYVPEVYCLFNFKALDSSQSKIYYTMEVYMVAFLSSLAEMARETIERH